MAWMKGLLTRAASLHASLSQYSTNGRIESSLAWPTAEIESLGGWCALSLSVPHCTGSSFTYEFRAESYGTSWYHSHFSAQYNDGLFGPMIIYGPEHVHYDIDLGPIILSDYIHQSYRGMIEGVAKKVPIGPIFPNVDNNLINGKGVFNCNSTLGGVCTPNAGLSKFKFTQGKTHRLRLINSGSAGTQKFSIDDHQLQVIAVDYVPIIPYTTNVVTLAIGQRADVLVTASGQSTAIYYDDANTTIAPTTTGVAWDSNDCANDPLYLTTPYTVIQPPDTPAVTQNMEITVGVNGSGSALFIVNNMTFRADYNSPLLLLASQGTPVSTLPLDWNIYNFSTSTSIRIHLTNLWETPHPMHLHGHDFWGPSRRERHLGWNHHNPYNPLRRDTHLMRPGTKNDPSYLVIEFEADNPGVWPLHCHTSTHVSAAVVGQYF
ncbi:hypothetical protein DID88_005606 [Monilinia fructigena]|uniref:Laccase n=1 Tax=Monilinia fructigena TaxID=38457 RepID=A0A395J097_9HELO|nr:hypothetical protein DID88_005606 [Monilinia fructigena]